MAQGSHSQVNQCQTFQGLLTLFRNNSRTFQFSEIQGLFKAGLEFKASTGTLQGCSSNNPHPRPTWMTPHFSMHRADADTLNISEVCRHICAIYNGAAELLRNTHLSTVVKSAPQASEGCNVTAVTITMSNAAAAASSGCFYEHCSKLGHIPCRSSPKE